MHKAGIKHDRKYSQEVAQDAFSAQFGHKVAVHCKRGIATELWMCIDDSLQPFDCPANVQRHCSSVTFPTITGAAIGRAGDIPLRTVAT
jgi:ribonuclease I